VSFHPRIYKTFFDDEDGFESSIFRSFLKVQGYFNIIDNNLINKDKYGEIKDSHVPGFPLTEADKLKEWQDKFPDWLKNKELKKWIFFLFNEQKRRSEAKEQHQKAVKNKNELTWLHAKTDTMKLFFNDRDESPRDLEQYEHDEKFNRYINFIKQMTEKKEKRNFDKFIKERVLHINMILFFKINVIFILNIKFKELFIDLHFTHSMTTDIFNFSPRGVRREGEIVTGCMVINKFYSKKLGDLINNDEKVFSELFSKENSILFAGDEKTEDGRTDDGRVVRTED